MPPGKGFPRRRASLGRPAALGAAGRLGVVGTHGRVSSQVLLQQPGGQFTGERADAALPLGEGDGHGGRFAVEIEVEGRIGLLEPLLAELFTAVAGVAG